MSERRTSSGDLDAICKQWPSSPSPRPGLHWDALTTPQHDPQRLRRLLAQQPKRPPMRTLWGCVPCTATCPWCSSSIGSRYAAPVFNIQGLGCGAVAGYPAAGIHDQIVGMIQLDVFVDGSMAASCIYFQVICRHAPNICSHCSFAKRLHHVTAPCHCSISRSSHSHLS